LSKEDISVLSTFCVETVIKMTIVKINIKTPCQESEDRELEAQSDWSVRNVKQEIEKQWANHPRPADQRLVYEGKLLQDDGILNEILRQDDEDLNCYTMHLICRQSSFSPVTKPKSTATSDLRHRKNVNNSQSASATELYQNYVAAVTPGASNRNAIPSSNMTGPSLTSEQTNPWQAYFNSQSIQANQNPNYLSQSPEQAMMMQQMYAHYMAQYMQYVQSGGMWPSYNINNTTNDNTAQAGAEQLNQHLQNQQGAAGLNPVAAGAAVAAVVGGHSTNPATAGQNVANQGNAPNAGEQNAALPQMNPQVGQAAPQFPAMNGPGANPGNVVMNAGAGGMGAMEEEDEDGMGIGGQRDILDWFYVASRVLVLFSIVYFYSSLARFALVAGLGLAVYLYRIGFFGQRNGGQMNIEMNNLNPNNNVDPNQQNDLQVHQNEEGEENREDVVNPGENVDQVENNDNGAVNENPSGAAVNNTPTLPNVQLEPSWYQVATTFLTTFFTSLMPNEPQVI